MATKALPFDERNQRDFNDMTARIRDALDLIRKNKNLRGTQDVLAELAQCSRRTLSLRVWPILELKKIKDARSNHINAVERKADVRNAVKTDSLLIKQVKNYQAQNGELFYRLQNLEEDKARSIAVISTLENQIQTLKEKLVSLEKESHRAKLRAL